MILSKKNYKKNNLLKTFYNNIVLLIKLFKKIFIKDFINTSFFNHRAIKILRSEDNNFVCNGCSLCLDICPSDCISLDINNDNDQISVRNFLIDENKCVQCERCVFICPVDALSFKE